MGTIDPAIKEWATPNQAMLIDAVNEHGSIRAAARALNRAFSGIHEAIGLAKRKAAARGYSPEHHLTRPVAPGYLAKGHSTLYRRGEAEPVLQWVKTSADAEAREALQRAAMAALSAELPRVEPIPFTGHASEHLATVYTLTDCHVGMLAWHRETGADWDLKIAERTLVGCFAQLIASAPASAIGVVNQLGDFLHQDGLAAITPTSGHNLDSDGRFPKIVETAIRILRRVIGMALAKHERVTVLLAEGNHDIVSSIWLRAMFKALYENEPRVTVLDSVLPYYVIEHGETMLAFHHGHLQKNAALPLLMAAQFPREWGRTTKRYIHTGHRHHAEEKEHSGVTVIQHPTLAARDAYAARGGWHAERFIQSITYHSKYGQAARSISTPEMIEA